MKVNKYLGLFLLTTTFTANLANFPIRASNNESKFISISKEKLESYDNNFGNESQHNWGKIGNFLILSDKIR